VTAWYKKSAELVQGTRIECAFVSTNSVAQGEQVEPLWKTLAPHRITINFAHQYFDWDTDGAGKAAVYVVIIGFAGFSTPEKHVVSYDDLREDGQETQCKTINAYLVPDGGDVLVESRRNPLSAPVTAHYGSMANEARPKGDKRPLFFFDDKSEYRAFVKNEPTAKRWLKPFVGADELLNDLDRWCLWLEGAKSTDLKSVPEVQKRVDAIRANRQASSRAATKELAKTAHLFGENRQPKKDYLAIPLHSSENRSVVPFRHYKPSTIVGNACAYIEGDDRFIFGILQSYFHMAWVGSVGGRLEGRYRYSIGLVFNNFPWPNNVSAKKKASVETAAKAVLAARSDDGGTLDSLYAVGMMPRKLVQAHRKLDAAVDACYGKRFNNDNERLRELFRLYKEQLTKGQGELLEKPVRKAPRPRKLAKAA